MVPLLALCSSSYVSVVTLMTTCRIFSLEMVHCCDHCNRLAFPTSLYIIIFHGGNSRSFIRHSQSVKNISTKFLYVKIAWHFIFNWRFLILCIILCVFLFVYIFLGAFWFVVLHRTFVDNDAFWFVFVVLCRALVDDDSFLFVLVCGTDLR